MDVCKDWMDMSSTIHALEAEATKKDADAETLINLCNDAIDALREFRFRVWQLTDFGRSDMLY